MEHIFDWLFACFCITMKSKKENGILDFGDLGDNVPYVFLKGK